MLLLLLLLGCHGRAHWELAAALGAILSTPGLLLAMQGSCRRSICRGCLLPCPCLQLPLQALQQQQQF